MSFIKPLITTIQTVSGNWYCNAYNDEGCEGLIKTLGLPRPKLSDICYAYCDCNKRILKDCTTKGDGTPVQLENITFTGGMRIYKPIIPAFKYNPAVFPPYGDTKHHWYIITYNPFKLLSLITDSKEVILDYIYINDACELHFVPLPDR